MDDGYIQPKRIEIIDKCPLCSTKLLGGKPTQEDALGIRYFCPNKNCEVESFDPKIKIYGCTICDEDTEMFSDIDDHPYCKKHIPLKEED